MSFVEIPPLTESTGWRGKRYPAGCTFVPQDLAIALGLEATTGIPVAEQGKPESPQPTQDALLRMAAERLEELKRIYDAEGKRDWAAIKEIGDRVGAQKHPDGWDASFLRIIEKEFSPEIAQELIEINLEEQQ
ncbi:MAG: hypothetical protein AAF215_05220 [Cyanobacteria bacterium P01_A01_bin.123]